MAPMNDSDTLDMDSVWLDEEAAAHDRQEELDLAFEREVEERLAVMRAAAEGAISAALKVWTPPPKLTVSEWADAERMLSPEASAEPGQWATDRVPYAREIMDSFNDPSTDTTVVMASSQVAKTEILLNVAGYVMRHDPGPMLAMQPTKEMAKTFSNDRLAPMLRDTPALNKLMGQAKSRDSKDTIWGKAFPGGTITMVGANAPAALASRPIRVILADEIDRYPISAGKEGDPLNLAIKRTTTFWNRKKFIVSTPTIKGHSRIETKFKEGDQRYWHVKCPSCEHEQIMRWANVKWWDGDYTTARYLCESEECGELWDEDQRSRAIAHGKWVATAPFNGTRSYSLNQLVSPWSTLSYCVKEFLEAKRGGIELLKTWTNTVLGETWELQGERVDDNELLERRVDYGDVCPAPVIVVTAGVDVQQDRIEVERVGWSANDQSFGLGKTVLWGDPTGPEVWKDLDALLLEKIPREDGAPLTVKATCVDSQYLTQHVASWCRDRWGRRVWAIRGVAGEGKPIWPLKPGKRSKTRLPFFNVGVDSVKEVVYARLRVLEPSHPGYCWFNMSYNADHFDQLTSEEIRTRPRKGIPVREWHLRPGKSRNEALDIRGYALAALEGLRMMGLKMRAGKEDGDAVAPKPLPRPKNAPVARPVAPAAPVTPTPTPPEPEKPRRVVKKKGRRIISSGI